MGARPRLTEGALAQISERIATAGCTEAYVCVDSERSLADMKRLHVALEQGLENAALSALSDEEDAELDTSEDQDEDGEDAYAEEDEDEDEDEDADEEDI